MNSLPQEAEPNVSSMEEFLRDTLRDTEALDEALDQLRVRREHLRTRLYALQLADDAQLNADVQRLADELGSGGQPPTFPLEALVERQGQ